jgi:hypothetical protein
MTELAEKHFKQANTVDSENGTPNEH